MSPTREWLLTRFTIQKVKKILNPNLISSKRVLFVCKFYKLYFVIIPLKCIYFKLHHKNLKSKTFKNINIIVFLHRFVIKIYKQTNPFKILFPLQL